MTPKKFYEENYDFVFPERDPEDIQIELPLEDLPFNEEGELL